jgi:hypothetical protein
MAPQASEGEIDTLASDLSNGIAHFNLLKVHLLS